MSYSFAMYFTPCDNYADALCTAHQFCESMKNEESIRKHIKSEQYYFPGQKSLSPKTDMEKYYAQVANIRALDGFFSLRFVYFHKTKLLALVGYDYPGADNFFKKNISFQNSCDQDYERSHWEGIELFEKIWDECSALTAEDIFNAMDESDQQFYTLEEIQDNLEYRQCSLAYERIYETMKLDKWLWGHNDEDFTRFSINVLDSQELFYLAQRLTKSILGY